MLKTFGLAPKEIIELRLKCLEPFVTIASKTNIEQDIVLLKAEKAWEYATKPLEAMPGGYPSDVQRTPPAKPRS